MSRPALAPGASAEALIQVTKDHLASTLEQTTEDGFPPVFATMQMIGLMELAASRVLHPLLEDGEVSVGVNVDVGHQAPTPPGSTVTARATFLGMEGKLYQFEVVAEDDSGLIGKGHHNRAIVDKQRIVDGASKRLPAD